MALAAGCRSAGGPPRRRPGLGKSLVTLDLAARVTTGSEMPDGALSDVADPLALSSFSEDDRPIRCVQTRPAKRMSSCAAVVRRMRTPPGRRQYATLITRAVSLTDVDLLHEVIARAIAKLVIVDPLMAYLGGDAHRDQDVRQALAPMAELAADTGAAVLVVRHLNKSGAAIRFTAAGFDRIIGAARAGLMVAKDPTIRPVNAAYSP